MKVCRFVLVVCADEVWGFVNVRFLESLLLLVAVAVAVEELLIACLL